MTTNPIRLHAAREAVLREYDTANALCRAAGISDTANADTTAEKWLLALRDNFLEDLERILTADYPQDEIYEHEKAPVSTYEQWEIWTELRLWQYDPDTAVTEAGEFLTRDYHTETHRAVKLQDIGELAESYEYEIAGNALGCMLQTAQTAYGEDDDE